MRERDAGTKNSVRIGHRGTPGGTALACAALVLSCGCSSAASPDATQPTECDGQLVDAPMERMVGLGHWNGVQLEPIQKDEVLALHFGPQGGQHIFVDVVLYAPGEAALDLRVTLSSETGMLLGQNQRRLEVCPNGMVLQRFFVFVQDAATTSGVLSAETRATTTAAATHSAPVSIRIARP